MSRESSMSRTSVEPGLVGAEPSCRAIVIQDNVRLVVARKNHRADRSQGRSWRLGWLTGRDDDGGHDLVREGLALGAVPDWEQPAEVAGRAGEQVREQAEERSTRPEGPARPLVDQPGPGDLFTPALPGGTPPEGAVPEPGGRERIALQLRVLDNGGNPRRTNEVVMSGHHATHQLTTHLRRRATARRFCDVLWTRLGR